MGYYRVGYQGYGLGGSRLYTHTVHLSETPSMTGREVTQGWPPADPGVTVVAKAS